MSVVALISKPEEIPAVVTWAHEFTIARESNLIIACWSESVTVFGSELTEKDEDAAENMTDKVNNFVDSILDTKKSKRVLLPKEDIEVRSILHPDRVVSIVQLLRKEEAELLVAASNDQTGLTGATYKTNQLLEQSPCNTVIIYGEKVQFESSPKVIVAITDGAHDSSAVSLAGRMSEKCNAKVTISRSEKDYEDEALEVGRRELRQILRNAGVTRNKRIKRQVFHAGDVEGIVIELEKNELILVGANNQNVVEQLVTLSTKPTVAVIKRSPPLRPWHLGRKQNQWVPRLSPADYADLIQNLRTNSKLNFDFLTMLGLAAAIASLGLLQDSPAVVIGSMLLAPLMTPMLGNGLALAQANPKLGKTSMKAIAVGFIFTLFISFIIGVLTPGEELTPQIVARGNPNLLDLGIALLSAAAAAYALARPNLVGAVAGVAIATALVPPLCSVGLAIAYQEFLVAEGAAILFVTNLVAIVIGAGLTFRMLGVSSKKAQIRQKLWVYRTIATLGIVMVILAFPLERALEKNIDDGKPQPNTFPLSKGVEEAITDFVKDDPEIEIIATGRPGSVHANYDVVIVLTSPHPLPRSYSGELTKMIREYRKDNNLRVAVYCVLNAWDEEEMEIP